MGNGGMETNKVRTKTKLARQMDETRMKAPVFPIASTRDKNEEETRRFASQFTQEATPPPAARKCAGKTSLVMVQGTGPIPSPKKHV